MLLHDVGGIRPAQLRSVLQGCQVILNGCPDNVPGHVETLKNHFVAHPAHFNPWQFRMLRGKRGGHILNFSGSLAYDLDVSDHGVLDLFILSKRHGTIQRVDVADRPFDSLLDVFQVVLDPLRMPHSG